MEFGKFNLKLILTAFAFGFVGYLGGVKTTNNSHYLRGQLDACNNIMSTINKGLPLGLKCDTQGGQVVVTSAMQPDVKYTLTGGTLGN